ncbi:hypothetical protein [Herbaspirillum rhizosphaerae]|uniref:hypothetical protein n=1 Tax=Herbaspirillum rhizosphaerae TaxID=346179 RepID=UPI0012ED8142|nr:hypothetical protein [Herbaspirillum rhizosphaerae]
MLGLRQLDALCVGLALLLQTLRIKLRAILRLPPLFVRRVAGSLGLLLRELLIARLFRRSGIGLCTNSLRIRVAGGGDAVIEILSLLSLCLRLPFGIARTLFGLAQLGLPFFLFTLTLCSQTLFFFFAGTFGEQILFRSLQGAFRFRIGRKFPGVFQLRLGASVIAHARALRCLGQRFVKITFVDAIQLFAHAQQVLWPSLRRCHRQAGA